ncbi:hypothetical protein CARUB_v10022079mg, partial [Capsella rubella]
MGNGLWKQEARASVEEPSQLEDERPRESINTDQHAWALPTEDTYSYNQQRIDLELFGPHPRIVLFGRVGLHCYNLRKGTNLQLLKVLNCDARMTSLISYSITLEAMDPVGHSSCEVQVQLRYAIENIGCLSAITSRCILKPKTPEEDDKHFEFNKYLVDYFYRGDMPEWITEDALTGRDKLQYYE